MELTPKMNRADRELGLMRELGLSSDEAAIILDLVAGGILSDADFHPRSFRGLVQRGILHPVVRSLGMHERWSDNPHIERVVLWYVWTGDLALLRWWSFRAAQPTFIRFLHPQTCPAYDSIQSFLAHPNDRVRQFIDQQCTDLDDRLMVWHVFQHFQATSQAMSLKTALSLTYPADEIQGPRAVAWLRPDYPAYERGHITAHVRNNQVVTIAPSQQFYRLMKFE